MKKFHFRIKPLKIQNSAQSGQKQFENEVEQQTRERLQNIQSKMSKVLDMFDKLLTSQTAEPKYTKFNPVTSNLGTNQACPSNSQLNQNHLETRDKHPIIDLPLSSSKKISKQVLEGWITNLCSTVFSISFNYYLKQQLSFDQTKVFCSESILINMLRLSQEYKMTSIEILNIDNHLKDKVLPYLSKKYPLTLQTSANKTLQNEVNPISHLESLDNDYLSMFNFMFQYRQSGNYNEDIMKFLNLLLEEIDTESRQSEIIAKNTGKFKEDITNFKDFEIYMTKIFQKTYNQNWMMKKQSSSIKVNSIIEEIVKEQVSIQSMISNPKNVISSLEQTKKNYEYKEKVKNYTKFAINQKIAPSENYFSDQQIKSNNLEIKNSRVLRILTKWCEELWKKFSKENYFRQRAESIQLQRPEYINPMYKWMRQKLDELMAVEKEKIQAFKQQLQKNSYEHKSQILFKCLQQDDSANYIPKFQKACGSFSVKVVKNLHNEIILFLNRLIHGLLTVAKTFHSQNVKGKGYNNWPVPPNLLTFTIGDLLRCKCTSRQKQIVEIFNQIRKISKQNPEKLKIVRIKNRLKQGTNDILINVKFNNIFLCEIQLGVHVEASKFIKCSNSFSHYIYELQRSFFGPITQICSVWVNFDKRSSQFQILEKYQKIKRFKTNKSLFIIDSPRKISKHIHKWINFNLPFDCNLCGLSYYSNNYLISNKKCKKCLVKKCIRCQFDQYDEEKLKKLVFKTKKLKKISPMFSKIDKNSLSIPQYGACINIESNTSEVELFKYSKIEGKYWLLGIKDDKIYEIMKINSQKDVMTFMNNYCIFELKNKQNDIILINDQSAHKFTVDKYIGTIYEEEKETMIMTQISFTEEQIWQMINRYSENYKSEEKRIKRIQFACNGMKNIKFLHVFDNITQINLDLNEIQDIKELRHFKKLEKLEMRQNMNIRIDNQEFLEFTYLRSIQFNYCKLPALPESINKLQHLLSIKLNVNNISTIPQSICDLKNLEELQLKKNKLTSFPENIGKLKSLKKLNLSQNKIKQLPKSIKQLTNLQFLDLSVNKLSKAPKMSSMKYLERFFIQKNNQISEFPEGLNELQLVQKIDISYNRIEELPQNFTKMKNLRIFIAENNKIQTLPSQFRLIPHLKKLLFKRNKISQLSDEFEDLKSLQLTIDLSGNKFIQFPKPLLQLQDIKQLDLSHNDIENLPQQIQNMFYLKSLDISFTKIRVIPNSIERLSHLRHLNISGLEMEVFPEFLERLIKQNNQNQDFSLEINHNKLSEVNLSLLENKGKIYFSDNLLTVIPVNMDMFNLTHLTLKSNMIKSIPIQIKIFGELVYIDLRKNQIQIIPEELSNLKKMNKNSLFLDDNPVTAVLCQSFVIRTGDYQTRRIINKLLQHQNNHESNSIIKSQKKNQKPGMNIITTL